MYPKKFILCLKITELIKWGSPALSAESVCITCYAQCPLGINGKLHEVNMTRLHYLILITE